MHIYLENDSINMLKLSRRAENCLKNNGYLTIGDVIQIPIEQLYAMKNAGKKTVYEIIGIKEKIKQEMGIDFCFETQQTEVIENYAVEEKAASLMESFYWEGLEYGDIPVEKMGLSFRSTNALVRNNINNLSELVKYGEEELFQLRNLGKKSVEEILEKKQHLLISARLLREEELDPELTEKLNDKKNNIQELVDHLYEKLSIIFGESIFLSQDIFQTVSKYYESEEELDVERVKEDKELLDQVFSSKYIRNLLGHEICQILSKKADGVTNNALLWYFSDGIPEKSIESTMQDLIHDNRVVIVEGLYKIYRKPFQKYVEEIKNERARGIVQERAKGKTLEEVGQLYGITRERVRQIEAKALKKARDLAEDRYHYLYTAYNLSKKDFVSVAKLTEEAYYYLSQKYERGNAKFAGVVEDPNIPLEIKRHVEKSLKINLVNLGGEYVKCTRESVIAYIIKTYFHETGTMQSFIKKYNEFISQYPEATQEKLSLGAENGLVNRLANRMDLLWKVNQQIRYYDINALDKDAFYEELDLLRYNDSQLSTLKVFRDNMTIMEKYDIQDYYELHNLIRKSINGNVKIKIAIRRMPIIIIGEGDADEQVYRLLVDHSPITAVRLGNLYEKKYGVTSELARASLFTAYEKYYHGGVYSIDVTPMPLEVKHRMKNELSKDFYFLEEVEIIYKRAFPDLTTDYLNPYSLKDLGYHVFSRYIIKDSFRNAQDYFKYLLTKDPIADLGLIHPDIRQIAAFSAILETQKRDYELLEYEPSKYYSIGYLQDMGIAKKNLKDYSYKIYEMHSGKEFFGISLVRNREVESICGLGKDFSNRFFESVLAQDMRFYSFKVGGNRVFCTEAKKASKNALFCFAMERTSGNDDNMVHQFLLNEYGVDVPVRIVQKAVSAIRRATEDCEDE